MLIAHLQFTDELLVDPAPAQPDEIFHRHILIAAVGQGLHQLYLDAVIAKGAQFLEREFLVSEPCQIADEGRSHSGKAESYEIVDIGDDGLLKALFLSLTLRAGCDYGTDFVGEPSVGVEIVLSTKSFVGWTAPSCRQLLLAKN